MSDKTAHQSGSFERDEIRGFRFPRAEGTSLLASARRVSRRHPLSFRISPLSFPDQTTTDTTSTPSGQNTDYPITMTSLPPIPFFVRALETAQSSPEAIAVVDGRTGQQKTYTDLLTDVAAFKEKVGAGER